MASSVGDQTWETARLLLRRPPTTDAGDVMRLHQDPLAIAHNPADALEDEQTSQQLVRRWTQHREDHGIGYSMVSWRDGLVVPGVCGVKVMTLDGHQVLNLLYRPWAAGCSAGQAGEPRQCPCHPRSPAH